MAPIGASHVCAVVVVVVRVAGRVAGAVAVDEVGPIVIIDDVVAVVVQAVARNFARVVHMLPARSGWV